MRLPFSGPKQQGQNPGRIFFISFTEPIWGGGAALGDIYMYRSIDTGKLAAVHF